MAGVVVSLVAARLRHAPGRRLIVAAGIAAATLVPVVAAGAAAVTADAALVRAVAGLPAGERTVTAAIGGPLEDAATVRLDAAVRRNLAALGGTRVESEVVYREASDEHGGDFVLAGTDGLAAAVRLLSGRLPSSCTPTRCEVLDAFPTAEDAAKQAPDRPTTTAALAALGLVVVGRAVRTDPLLLSGSFDPDAASASNAAAQVSGPGTAAPPRVRVLLAGELRGAAALASLALFQRSYGWVQPLDTSRVQQLGVDAWSTRSARVADVLGQVQPAMVLIAPVDTLRAQQARADASSGRFALLGGTAGVLLLGTAVAGGAALRRDHSSFLDALRRRGAGRGRRAAVVAGEVVATVLVAGLAGLLVGAGLVAGLAGRSGNPVVRTALAAVGTAAPAAAGLLVCCAGLLALALCWSPSGVQADGRTARGAVAATAGGCVAVAALLAARGGVGAAGAGSADPLLPALPALVLLAAGLLAALAWPPLAGLAAGRLPRDATAARLGLAAVVGRPLRAVTTAALVTAAVGAAVFAGAYRATLVRGAQDQAAFSVPLDLKVTTGAAVRSPLALAAASAYASGGSAYPVLRQTGSVRVGPNQADAVEVVGVDPAVLPRISRWPAISGNGDAAAAARQLSGGVATAGAVRDGVPLPAGRTLSVLAPAAAGAGLQVTAWVRTRDGRERAVVLTAAGSGLTGALPDLGAPAYLAAVAIRPDPYAADRKLHAIGEARRGLPADSGRLVLDSVTVDGRPVPGAWSGWSGTGLAAGPGGGSATLTYRLDGGVVVLDARPGGAGTPAQPLPVLADPTTAATAQGRTFTLLLDARPVVARVVGVLPRFPTAGDRFAVTDVATLARLADRDTPGSGQPDEVWVKLPAGRAFAADQDLTSAVTVAQRTQVEAALRSDPVARGALLLLLGGTGLTLLVALVALVLLVVTERQDDAGELYAWEADGVRPGVLRAGLWWRAVAVAAVAVPAGVLAGLVLTRLTARLVAVTAGAVTPRPPLVPGAGAGWAAVAVAAGLLAALAVAGGVAAAALREPLPLPARGAP